LYELWVESLRMMLQCQSNNNIRNLEWCDRSYNNLHAYKIGLKQPRYKPCVLNDIYYKSQSEASEKLKVSRTTVDNWIKQGKGYYL